MPPPNPCHGSCLHEPYPKLCSKLRCVKARTTASERCMEIHITASVEFGVAGQTHAMVRAFTKHIPTQIKAAVREGTHHGFGDMHHGLMCINACTTTLVHKKSIRCLPFLKHLMPFLGSLTVPLNKPLVSIPCILLPNLPLNRFQ